MLCFSFNITSRSRFVNLYDVESHSIDQHMILRFVDIGGIDHHCLKCLFLMVFQYSLPFADVIRLNGNLYVFLFF